MKYLLLVSLLAFQAVSSTVPPLPTGPELSELSKLKAENFKLKAQFAQCQIDLIDRESRLASSTLTSQQSILEKQFRLELKCNETDKFNWATLKCEPGDVKKDPTIK